MRWITAVTFAALGGLLLAVPTPRAQAGNYGCSYSQPVGYGARYYYPAGYYPATTSGQYYTQTYSAPTYAPPVSTCVDTPSGTVCNHGYGTGSGGLSGGYGYGSDYQNSILYRIAPDLANARLAEVAAEQTLAKFQTMIQKQQAEAEAKADKQATRDFQLQVIQLLAARGQAGPPPNYPAAAPGPDPQALAFMQQLQAENAQMRAALEKIASTPQPPPAPRPPDVPAPPTAPVPQRGTPGPVAVNPNAAGAEVVKKYFAANCTSCHKPNSERLDLTEPARLAYEDLSDCVNKMLSNNPKFVMPKGKAPGSNPPEATGAVHDLSTTAARRYAH